MDSVIVAEREIQLKGGRRGRGRREEMWRPCNVQAIHDAMLLDPHVCL